MKLTDETEQAKKFVEQCLEADPNMDTMEIHRLLVEKGIFIFREQTAKMVEMVRSNS